MELCAELERRGGWLHRADLIDAGWSADRILAARRKEGIELLRRQWLLLPSIGDDLRTAAALGGVVSCVSALARLDLWLPKGLPTQVHLAVPPHTGSTSESSVCHRSHPVTARRPRSLLDEIENVLANVASCLPKRDAFCVWESAANRRRVTPQQLRRIPWRSRAAKDLAKAVSEQSDSGMESTFVWNCRRAGIRAVQQVRIAGHRVDFLIGRHLVVQLDGWAYHKDAAQRRRDIRHDRALTALGCTVLRFDYYDVMHDWPRVEAELRRGIAAGAAD
ncbi:MAG: endonuclease domain-containing protein [Microbacterium sp.]|uniref:endonuclease domain-containing protein n=1 Tax=Microbacterium sp. TaxID=51671 RepID=UPI003F95B8D7